MFFPSLSTLFIAVLVVTAFYYAVLEFRWFHALGTVRLGKAIREPLPSVSILIAARNEKGSIQKNIDSILQQDYQGPWDIWVADDHSTDDTPQILARYATQKNNKFHINTIKDLSEGQGAKKNAFALMGIRCESEILFLTDANLHLQKIAAHYPWKARYGANAKTFVKTTGMETLKGLWEQRKQGISKMIDDSPRFVFLLCMIFFLALCIVGPLSFFSGKILIATLIIFAVNVFGDRFLSVHGRRIFNQQQLLKWFLPFEFFHTPFMVLSVLFWNCEKIPVETVR
jgi:glycosyltransferase involved in cell wall biosynthesis